MVEIQTSLTNVKVTGENELTALDGCDSIGVWIDTALYCLHRRQPITLRMFRDPVTVTPAAIVDAVHPVKGAVPSTPETPG